MNNQELFYTYQGLTDDGTYYVAVIFPVSHPDLPADISSVPEDPADDYETYLNSVTEQLNLADAAANDAARVTAGGFIIDCTPAGEEGNGVAVDWINPPYFYRLDDLIARYVGTDESILTLLESVLGMPFAGDQ